MEIIVQLFTTFFVFILIAVLLMYSVRIIPQSNAYVVERFGGISPDVSTWLAYHPTNHRSRCWTHLLEGTSQRLRTSTRHHER